MCFMLYAGAAIALPRKEWRKEKPDISIASLTEHEAGVQAHFTKPEVQSIGSTSGCGCDFPCVTLQNGEWPCSITAMMQSPDFRFKERGFYSVRID